AAGAVLLSGYRVLPDSANVSARLATRRSGQRSAAILAPAQILASARRDANEPVGARFRGPRFAGAPLHLADVGMRAVRGISGEAFGRRIETNDRVGRPVA